MRTIRYETTHFIKPSKIDEKTYYAIKKQLIINPNYDIEPKSETFTEHNKGLLLTISLSFVIFAVTVLIMKDERGGGSSIWNPIMGISMLTFIGASLRLLLVGPSYATFLKEKKEYFSRLKYAIQNSNSYDDFIKTFYQP